MQSIIITKTKNKNKINKSNDKSKYFDKWFDKIIDININNRFLLNNNNFYFNDNEFFIYNYDSNNINIKIRNEIS